MSLFKILSAVAVLALASTAAFAFQEQQAAPSGAAAPAADSSKPAAAAAETQLAAPSAGTEVRIPGLGKLGILPKMDFGLELLYGASEQKQPEPPGRDDSRDDLTIRGTVKHRF